MSGGHWNYKQRDMRLLGEALANEPEPVLKAAGEMLIDMAEALDGIDRIYCGDASHERYADLINNLRNIVGPEKTISIIMGQMRGSLHSLEREMADIAGRPHRSPAQE